MDKKKYLDGIFKRVDYLASMASLYDADIEALDIELDDINAQIKVLKESIKLYTPSSADMDAAKSKDEIRLSTKKTELDDIIYQQKELQDSLSQEKDNLLQLLDEISRYEQEKSTLEEQVELLSTYPNMSREFKMFITDNKKRIDKLTEKVEHLSLDKSRCQNSVDLLNEELEQITLRIKSLTEEIESIKYKLSSNKAYENTTLIKEKTRIKANYIEELQKLEARKTEIENTPAYIAKKIKMLIEKKQNESSVRDLINKLVTAANKQPYMSIVIRDNNISALEDEYEVKCDEKRELEKRISKTDYSLKQLSIEQKRTSSLEQLINLYNDQIALHETIIKNNNVAISSLASQVRELDENYNTKKLDVDAYKLELDNDSLTSRQVAFKKREYEKMKKVLAEEKAKIRLYKVNITSLIKDNKRESEIIASLKSEVKSFSKETSEILNSQLSRNNYFDVIRQNKDQEELKRISLDIKYLEKRLRFKNYNVSQLKSEILHGIKFIYQTAKKKSEYKIILDKVDMQPVIKDVKDSIVENKVTSLDELLNTSKQITKKDVKESVDSFEKTLESISKSSKHLVEDLPQIDVAAIVENAKDKQEKKKAFKLSMDEYQNLISQMKFKVDSKEEKKEEQNTRLKVVSIEPIKKPEETIVQTPVVDNKSIKVISVEPLKKEEKKEEQNKLSTEDIFNMVYRPFEVSADDITKKLAA